MKDFHFRDSIRAHLIDDAPDGQDVRLPSDGSAVRILGWVVLVEIGLIVGAFVGLLIWWLV